MPIPIELKPTSLQRVIDLVREAGVDVSDWANYKQGAENPGANPRYCYEWAFIQPEVLVVLNLWYDKMIEVDGRIEQHFNFRKIEQEMKGIRKARLGRRTEAVAEAYRTGLPVRVIVLDRLTIPAQAKSSTTSARLLDPVAWAVTTYNETTGEVVLRRGVTASAYVDQFSLIQSPDGQSVKRNVITTAYDRNPEVRRLALARAEGKCQFCGSPGFYLPDGRTFLETHHVIPLAENGADDVSNVVALCPNHHREAHYGLNAKDIRQRLLNLLRNP